MDGHTDELPYRVVNIRALGSEKALNKILLNVQHNNNHV